MKSIVGNEKSSLQINLLDARGRGNFEGTVPSTPPPGVRGTHIPGFKNFPAAELVEEGLMRDNDEIRSCELIKFKPTGVAKKCGNKIKKFSHLNVVNWKKSFFTDNEWTALRKERTSSENALLGLCKA
ncbi:hypothetical protein COOONC_15567 [Cooperia oncophora]